MTRTVRVFLCVTFPSRPRQVSAVASTASVSGVGSARWPDGTHQGEVAHGFGLIPVSVAGEGVQVGGSVEQKEEKVGMFRSDMACGWHVFEIAHRIVSTCS